MAYDSDSDNSRPASPIIPDRVLHQVLHNIDAEVDAEEMRRLGRQDLEEEDEDFGDDDDDDDDDVVETTQRGPHTPPPEPLAVVSVTFELPCLPQLLPILAPEYMDLESGERLAMTVVPSLFSHDIEIVCNSIRREAGTEAERDELADIFHVINGETSQEFIPETLSDNIVMLGNPGLRTFLEFAHDRQVRVIFQELWDDCLAALPEEYEIPLGRRGWGPLSELITDFWENPVGKVTYLARDPDKSGWNFEEHMLRFVLRIYDVPNILDAIPTLRHLPGRYDERGLAIIRAWVALRLVALLRQMQKGFPGRSLYL